MTPSGRSLFYFGIYVVSTGLLFILIPETLISITQLPSIPPGWARVVGLLTLILGIYDVLSGKGNIKLLITASIYVRFFFAFGTVLLVVFGQMPITLILFGAVDALSALWTAIALKSETSHS